MALCLDPRWDLRKTYWLINGIAGIDPASGSIGSAVWTGNVVDGDAMREIGEKEMPAGWPYGLFAIGTTHPDELPKKQGNGGWGGAELAYTMNYPLEPRPDALGLRAFQGRGDPGLRCAQGVAGEVHGLPGGAKAAACA